MREYEQAEALAARALELSEKHQFPPEAALSRCVLGQARAQLGRATEGIALIRQGIAGLLEIGTRIGISNFTTYLAEAQEREGAIVDALETVEQALQANPDELVYRPETLRLRGELRLKQGQTELAEADFREAIALAQTMSAKAWELRATMSLARLLDKQGRRDEARTMLADIYNWFTEGFDTADLKDAKALLSAVNTANQENRMAVIFITGSSTGIGLATAVAFGRAGHDVYATMRNPDRAPELASIAAKERLPIKVLPMDVDNDASVGKAVAGVLAESGRIDVLVNNAGIAVTGPVEELPLAEFRRVMETNYFGALRCIQAVVRGMRERRDGHIINVSSIQGRISIPSYAAYAASKWALEAASEALAQETKSFGIKVSIVEPGMIATPVWDKRREVPANTRYRQERRIHALVNALLKQPVTPFVVADKIVEIVQSKTWKLRHTVGPDAEPTLQYRASMTDEQWVDLQSVESDQEWLAIVKRDFGVDVDLL